MVASVTSGLRKKAVMNLPEPSGSSPPEKPPGTKMIWLSRTARAKRAADSETSAADWLRSTMISGSRPARMTARALSYSQLVPGNTGMTTRGLAEPVRGLAAGCLSEVMSGTEASSFAVRFG